MSNDCSGRVLLALSAAFDTVDHGILGGHRWISSGLFGSGSESLVPTLIEHLHL